MAVRFADVARATTSAYSPTTGPTTALVAGLGVAALGAATLIDPTTVDQGPVVCPFRHATGLPCPGCGLIRSWVYLMHGQWHDGVVANPFGVVAVLFVGLVAGVTGLAVVRRRPVPALRQVFRGRVFWAVVSAWVGFGIVRLIAVLVT